MQLWSSSTVCVHSTLLPTVCCRAGVQLSQVTVAFKDLEVSVDVNIGSRGMPTVANAFINTPRVSPGSQKKQCVAMPAGVRL